VTSFSTYGTGRLALVDGSLATDEELAAEQLDQITNAIAAGAARALLDTTRDEADPEAEVYAEQWHSAAEGWELGAIVTGDLPPFMDMCERFVRENVQNVLTLANRIAWDPRWASESYWHGDEGMAIYRIGMCLGYSVHGDGISFSDYSQPTRIDGEVLTPWRDPIVDPLEAWVNTRTNHPHYEDTWIDTTEEPCLLHLRG
jgi:hypothetical protein